MGLGDIGTHWGDIRSYWGHMGIMEKKMEATIMGSIGFRV